MKKQEFLNELRKRLKGVAQKDVEERISFYDEMIEDIMADGKNEEEAVQEVGNIDDIVKQVLSETPLVSLFKEKIKPKRSLNAWETILLVLGFPLWFPLLITFFCLALTAYILLWVGVIVAYSIEFAFIAVGLAGIVCFFAYLFGGRFNLVCLGSGLIGVGLA